MMDPSYISPCSLEVPSPLRKPTASSIPENISLSQSDPSIVLVHIPGVYAFEIRQMTDNAATAALIQEIEEDLDRVEEALTGRSANELHDRREDLLATVARVHEKQLAAFHAHVELNKK